ncbi:MAG: adventurous gliding motility protein CglF [Myxococcota bacterium]
MRRLVRLGVVAAALVATTGAPALAQETTQGADGQTYQRKTVINFEDDTIEGDLKTPDGEYLEARKKARHKSLIKIRENFRLRILQSASSL